MANCGPACTVPSCASSPVVGFGSAGSSGLGYGGLGYGYGGLGYGGLGYGYGAVENSGNLGTLAGVYPSCINQLPPAEVVVQPPASVVTIPGAILSASCEPVSVGGMTPCAIAGSGIVGAGLYGSLGSGFGKGALGRGGGYFGRGALLGRCGSVCGNICV
ncbi:shematrin-like protein 2 [Hemicordylus capensis]|uniref:shematrin-like protein 2 n=1 Tax=Hemicordylus capensis TaxID=884348 RepID=UPI0023025AE5|nr:shematrin-like protein 2 [Hemicordylus capensis]